MNPSLDADASALTNLNSGIASDYLNHFNEVFLMVENFPILLPEMIDEMSEWRPITYTEYFEKSPLPGSAEALRIYAALDKNLRADFEAMVETLNGLARGAIQVILAQRMPDGSIDPEAVSDSCAQHSADLRAMLERTAHLVNYGYALPLESSQNMADRLMAAHPHKAV